MKTPTQTYTVQTSRGPVRFHSVGEPIAAIDAQPAAQPAHTPTPWHVDNCPSGFIYINAGTARIARIEDQKYMTEEDAQTDAAFIVAAVNTHAGLVSKNQELKDRLAGYKESAQGWNANFCALNQQHKTKQAENVARIAELEAALDGLLAEREACAELLAETPGGTVYWTKDEVAAWKEGKPAPDSPGMEKARAALAGGVK